MGVINSSGDIVQIRWPGVFGGRYDVEATTNLLLNPGGWSTVGAGIMANTTTNLVWTNALPEKVFYRLKRWR